MLNNHKHGVKLSVINGVKYIFTQHLRERIRERFENTKQRIDNRNTNLKIIETLQDAKENKSIFNNTAFITSLYEKYGTDQRMIFLQNDDYIFIGVSHKTISNCFVLVTCYSAKTSTKSHFWKKNKF